MIKNGMIKIHVSQLRLGMFVSDLDCGWLQTDYLVQGVSINSLADMERLAKFATYVWVDPVRGTLDPSLTLKSIDKDAVGKVTSSSVWPNAEDFRLEKRKVHYERTTDVAAEHANALKIYEKGKSDVKSMMHGIATTGTFDLEVARDLVAASLKSILRNPDALLWMGKIREVDEYTAEHCLNVSLLAMVFGRHLGLREKDLVKVGLAGLLHDLGKLQTPSEILNKPGKLTEEEFNIMREHAKLGYLMLKNNQALPGVVTETAHSHHERIDGKGYPRKIRAVELPEIVRLISIVDTYDAITAERCYSKPKSSTVALGILYEERGTQFDEDLVLEFIRCMGIYPPGVIVELINGYIGLVIEINEGFKHLPKILLLRDSEGVLNSPYTINLLEVEQGVLSNQFLVRRTLSQGTHGIYTKDYTR